MSHKLASALPITLLAMLLPMAGCGNESNASTTTPGNENDTSAPMTGSPAANSSLDLENLDADQFVKIAASSGMYEVQSAQLALDKNVPDPLQQFAQRMIEDHGKANDRLEQVAKDAGITVPDQMMQKHQDMLAKLKGLTGQDFVTAYSQQQLQAHQNAVDLFQRASKSLDNPQLQQFAQDTLPVLEQHLSMIKSHQTNGSQGNMTQPGANPTGNPTRGNRSGGNGGH